MKLKLQPRSFPVCTTLHFMLSTVLLVCASPLLASAESDDSAPVIQHNMDIQSILTKVPLKVEAVVTDNAAVAEVMFFYRNKKGQEFYKIQMRSDGKTHYSAVVPQEEIKVPLFEYYIQATDTAGNIALRGIPFFPLKIAVSARATQKEMLPPSRSIFSEKPKTKAQEKRKESFLPPPSF